jgi:hypothetical protein
MSEKYATTIVVDPMLFDKMMLDDDIKNYMKAQLALDISNHLIENDIVKFTYTRDRLSDMITLKAEMEL